MNLRTASSLSLCLLLLAAPVACGDDDGIDSGSNNGQDDTSQTSGTGDGSGTGDTGTGGDSDDSDDGDGDTGGRDTDTAGDDTTDGADDSTTTGDGDSESQIPPIGDAALRAWLENGSYLTWTAESSIHESAGPHLTDVRTYINDAMLASFESNADLHPAGVALVKELYRAGSRSIDGYAVMRKATGGDGGNDWYWYEVIGTNVVADGTGVGICTGCHSAGIDFVRTPFPLQ